MESQTAITTKTTKAVVVLAVARAMAVSVFCDNSVGIGRQQYDWHCRNANAREKEWNRSDLSQAKPNQAFLLVFLIISIPTIRIISEYLITLHVYVEVNEHLDGNVTTKS